MKLHRRVSVWLLSAMALILVTFILLPVFYMVMMPFKSGAEIVQNPLGFPERLNFENYRNALSKMNYVRSVLNSVGITLSVTVLVSFIGALAAYPLARHTNGLARALVLLMALGLSTPYFVTNTPIYVIFRDIGLLDTYLGLILAFTALNLPLAVFFYTGFIRGIPLELDEAARLDNCSEIRIFWHVIRPLLGPTTATLSLFVMLMVWYAGTKAAIVAMTRAMAWSLGKHGIRVNSLSPGLTLTEAMNWVKDHTGLRLNRHSTG